MPSSSGASTADSSNDHGPLRNASSSYRVVDFDRPRADLDRPLHARRGDTCIDVAAHAVQRLGSRIVDAHSETQAIESTSACFALSMDCQRGTNTVSPVLRPDLYILKFRRIGQREVCVREWLSTPPSDEINPVALVQARQAEDCRDRLNLTWIERMDLMNHAHRLPDPKPIRFRSGLPGQKLADLVSTRKCARPVSAASARCSRPDS